MISVTSGHIVQTLSDGRMVTVQVIRADQLDIPDKSVNFAINLAGVTAYEMHNYTRPTPEGWARVELRDEWQYLYDTNNSDGGEYGEALISQTHESYVLLRIAKDNPNNHENDDRYIAVNRNELVTVQVISAPKGTD